VRILIVEDNGGYADRLVEHLRLAFRDAEIEVLTSERVFHDVFPDLEEAPPNVALVDVMLRWDRPTRDDAGPPKTSAYDAGIRCAKRLAEGRNMEKVGIILYTVVDAVELETKREGLPSSVRYVQKTADYVKLIATIRELTQ
jgi:hypothetical protein